MKRILSYIASFAVTSAPLVTLAQQQGQIPGYLPVPNIVTSTEFVNRIGTIANIVGSVLMGIAVIMILVAGYFFLTAGGSEDKITTARGYLVYALVGVAVALLAFALPAVIRSFLGA